MADYQEKLAALGLAEYIQRFVDEGFDSWETLLEIHESDLEALGVKLGHRRKLQRAIADARIERGPPALATHSSNGSTRGSPQPKDSADASDHPTARPKRRYKRHPKPDPCAPERPVSAYVLFSNDVRERLKNEGQELKFCDMAKVVGEQWQNLPADERESYEAYAANRKSEYNAALAEYKRTEPYRDYQRYLANFKATHKDTATSPEPRQVDSKRFKLRHESSSTGTETGSSLSSAEPSISSHQGSTASPPSSLSDPRSRPASSILGAPPRTGSPAHDHALYLKHSPSAHAPPPLPGPRAPAPHALAAPDRVSRRRASSSAHALGPTTLAALEPGAAHPVAPPAMRSANNDSPLTLRSLPPPIPSRGAPYGLSSNAINPVRKQDPMDALIAAAESQAPRMVLGGEEHQRG